MGNVIDRVGWDVHDVQIHLKSSMQMMFYERLSSSFKILFGSRPFNSAMKKGFTVLQKQGFLSTLLPLNL